MNKQTLWFIHAAIPITAKADTVSNYTAESCERRLGTYTTVRPAISPHITVCVQDCRWNILIRLDSLTLKSLERVMANHLCQCQVKGMTAARLRERVKERELVPRAYNP